MKIGREKKFIHNKNVVVCIIKSRIFIRTACGYVEEYVIITRGVAKCSPQDKFDLRQGKMIAESRAILKFLKRATALQKEELEEAYYNVSLIEKDLEKLKTMSITESVHYDSLV